MIKNIYKLSELKDALPWHGKTVTLAGGCFDLLHYGHVLFMENAKKESDILVIALESDEFIQEKKNRQPVHSQLQRAHILSCLRAVDYVIMLDYLKDDYEYTELVEIVKPKIIAVTDSDPHIQVKKGHANMVGAEVKVVAPLVKPFSSSQIITYENILSD